MQHLYSENDKLLWEEIKEIQYCTFMERKSQCWEQRLFIYIYRIKIPSMGLQARECRETPEAERRQVFCVTKQNGGQGRDKDKIPRSDPQHMGLE